jgi:hypothetical protein
MQDRAPVGARWSAVDPLRRKLELTTQRTLATRAVRPVIAHRLRCSEQFPLYYCASCSARLKSSAAGLAANGIRPPVRSQRAQAQKVESQQCVLQSRIKGDRLEPALTGSIKQPIDVPGEGDDRRFEIVGERTEENITSRECRFERRVRPVGRHVLHSVVKRRTVPGRSKTLPGNIPSGTRATPDSLARFKVATTVATRLSELASADFAVNRVLPGQPFRFGSALE